MREREREREREEGERRVREWMYQVHLVVKQIREEVAEEKKNKRRPSRKVFRVHNQIALVWRKMDKMYVQGQNSKFTVEWIGMNSKTQTFSFI